jgi:hypothetical protein
VVNLKRASSKPNVINLQNTSTEPKVVNQQNPSTGLNIVNSENSRLSTISMDFDTLQEGNLHLETKNLAEE